MANHDNSIDEKTVERPDAGSGPDGTQSRPADAFAGKGSSDKELLNMHTKKLGKKANVSNKASSKKKSERKNK